ncbi:hypothetical protein FOZ61_010890 [Perkinsus olseni]|uniref:RING-type domain-containing protein n=1 Tax=Perkinsus olseni TaxID=32597 RepID=A0A7J6M1N4_PEROL|nr:hypothetical protein FOZ61_010890 [Perkinsus olseni]
MTTKEFIVEKNATLSSSVVTSAIRRVGYFTLGSASTTVKEDALIVKDAARRAMSPCGKPCGEQCDRPPCEKPCSLILECGHTCQGLCGNLCPICPRCHPKVRCVLTGRDIGLALEDTSRLYELPDCGHTFFVTALDKYMSAVAENLSAKIDKGLRPRRCPACDDVIYMAPRYGSILKTYFDWCDKAKIALVASGFGGGQPDEIDAGAQS